MTCAAACWLVLVVSLCVVLDKIVEHFSKEWQTLKEAPGAFIVSALGVGVLVYGAASWRYESVTSHLDARLRLQEDGEKAMIETLGAQIKLRDDQLTAKVATSSDALTARVERLEADNAFMKHLGLTPGEKAALAAALKLTPGAASICTGYDRRASNRHLTEDLTSAFQQAGWHTPTTTAGCPAPSTTTGLVVYVRDPSTLTPSQRAIVNGLKEIDLPFEVRERSTKPDEPDALLAVFLPQL